MVPLPSLLGLATAAAAALSLTALELRLVPPLALPSAGTARQHDAAPPAPTTGRLRAGSPAYAHPDPRSAPLFRLPYDLPVQPLAQQGPWQAVQLGDGRRVWVWSVDLARAVTG